MHSFRGKYTVYFPLVEFLSFLNAIFKMFGQDELGVEKSSMVCSLDACCSNVFC
jgi:hypothetical protein